MSGISWWCFERVSRRLESDEREAVRGDFAEAGVSGGRALLELVGLVARRQAALWIDWRPWAVLFGVAVPCVILFSKLSWSLLSMVARQVHTLQKYGVRYDNGLTDAELVILLVSQALALMAWAFCSGFVVGSLSRKTIWVNGALLSVMGLTVGPGPLAAIFVLPSFWGVRVGLRDADFKTWQVILFAIGIAIITFMAGWSAIWWQSAFARWSEGG